MELAATPAAEGTKSVILRTALDLFRSSGFELTTMRDIARAAHVATGAAYYYFPSKEAIVSAYYEQVQSLHAEKVREAWKVTQGLRARLGVLLHLKLEILKDDRRFLGALFRYTGEPNHPLSVFGEGSQRQRSQSIELFREAIAGSNLNDELWQLLPPLLWLGYLGIVLSLIHDETEGQKKTHKFVDGALDLLVQAVEWSNSPLIRPFIQPFQSRVLRLMQDSGWV